jgi:ubiquinone/menaquinone biosynthesis C-methylase UbiE
VPSAEKDRVRTIYETAAPRHDRGMRFSEPLLLGDARQWACARAQGEVLELAIGTGLNLPLYRSEVRLTGIELSPAMLAVAKQRATELGREVDLRVGDAEALEFEDASFDTVICTYALCTIPDDRRAISEAHRVLRPGGKLVLAEHVRSPVWVIRVGQRLLEPLMLRLDGDHLLREPLEHVRAQGFAVDELERTRLGFVERLAAHKLAGV